MYGSHIEYKPDLLYDIYTNRIYKPYINSYIKRFTNEHEDLIRFKILQGPKDDDVKMWKSVTYVEPKIPFISKNIQYLSQWNDVISNNKQIYVIDNILRLIDNKDKYIKLIYDACLNDSLLIILDLDVDYDYTMVYDLLGSALSGNKSKCNGGLYPVYRLELHTICESIGFNLVDMQYSDIRYDGYMLIYKRSLNNSTQYTLRNRVSDVFPYNPRYKIDSSSIDNQLDFSINIYIANYIMNIAKSNFNSISNSKVTIIGSKFGLEGLAFTYDKFAYKNIDLIYIYGNLNLYNRKIFVKTNDPFNDEHFSKITYIINPTIYNIHDYFKRGVKLLIVQTQHKAINKPKYTFKLPTTYLYVYISKIYNNHKIHAKSILTTKTLEFPTYESVYIYINSNPTLSEKVGLITPLNWRIKAKLIQSLSVS